MDQTAQVAQAVVAAVAAAHQGPLGIGWDTWAIVFPTLANPILAILVSLLLTARTERRSQLRNRRFWVFRTLLATRGQAITQEHVSALNLNLIEIDYHGVSTVMTAWRVYMDHLNSTLGRPLEHAETLGDGRAPGEDTRH